MPRCTPTPRCSNGRPSTRCGAPPSWRRWRGATGRRSRIWTSVSPSRRDASRRITPRSSAASSNPGATRVACAGRSSGGTSPCCYGRRMAAGGWTGSSDSRTRPGRTGSSPCRAQPQYAIDDHSILNWIIQGMRQRLVRRIVLVLVVDVVVTHVEVDHPVVLVGPNDGIEPTVPDLVRFRPGAQRKAGRVYGEQNVDVRILPQVFFPAVPLTGRGAKRLGQMGSRRMVAVFDPENGRRRSPRVTDV